MRQTDGKGIPGRNWKERAKIELSNILRALSGVDIDRERVVR